MSPVQIFSLALLVLAFAIAMARHMNVGFTTIPAGFLLCFVAGVPVDAYFARFPGSLVVLILGVTFLFGHAQRSGAIDLLTGLAVGATGRRDWMLPWIMFALAAALSGIGALPAASLAIVVPIAIRAAHQRRINPVMMGLVTISGALAGGFSPISVWGQLVLTLAKEAGRPLSAPGLFLIEFALNLLVACVAFALFGGPALIRRPPGPDVARDPAPSGTTTPRTTPYQITSLLGIAAFVATVLVFDVDVGLAAFSVALVLQVVHRPDEKETVRALPWSVVLVITGVLLYVGVLQQVGTLKAISHHLGGISSTGLAILALTYVGSLFASFESSSVAVLGLVVPVALHVTSGVEGTALLLIVCAVCWAIVVSSPSPYHLSGGLVLASSPEPEQPRMFRRLLAWSLSVAAVVPLIGWLLPTLGPG